MSFVARGQVSCNGNISLAFKSNALSYAQRILANSDFGGKFVLTTETPADLQCTCSVSTANWVSCCWLGSLEGFRVQGLGVT
jgi:hypothetical protein